MLISVQYLSVQINFIWVLDDRKNILKWYIKQLLSTKGPFKKWKTKIIQKSFMNEADPLITSVVSTKAFWAFAVWYGGLMVSCCAEPYDLQT